MNTNSQIVVVNNWLQGIIGSKEFMRIVRGV